MLSSVVALVSGGDVTQTRVFGFAQTMLQTPAPGSSAVHRASLQRFRFPRLPHPSCPSSEQMGRWVVVDKSEVRQPQAWSHP